VEKVLREEFYEGRGLWKLAAEPFAEGSFLGLLLVVVGLIFVREELAAEWRRLWTALTELDSTSDYHWDSPANRRSNKGRIRLRWNIRERVEGLWFGRVQHALRSTGHTDAKRDSELIPGRIGADQPSISAPISADSAPKQRLEPPPIDHSKWPANQRFIFPGKTAVRTSNEKPKPWDESQWID
jgi:hypothetical protein